MGKFRKSAFSLLLLAASIFFFLLVFELLLRAFAPQNLNPFLLPTEDRETFAQYDAKLGWSLKPDIGLPFFSHEYNVNITQNSHGMRDEEYRKAKEEGKYRIAVAGDSFAWGFGVENNEVFTEVLEEKLGDNFQVLNFGVSGYGTDQEFLQFKSKIIDFAPDMLIIMFYQNDVENIVSSTEYGYEKPMFVLENGKLALTNVPVPQHPRDKTRYGVMEYANFILSHYSHSYVFVKSGLAMLYANAMVVFDRPEEYFDTKILKKEYDDKYNDGWILFDALLREFRKAGKQENTTIVLVNMPAKAQADKKLFGRKLRIYGKDQQDYDLWKPSGLLRRYADRNGIEFIDLLPYFLSEKEPEKHYFRFNDHLNARGNRFIAEVLYKELESDILWKDG